MKASLPVKSLREPAMEKIGNYNRLIGVGEATHGSVEFNSLRKDMFQFLVEKCGYTIFLIEADFSSFLPVSEYVETGKGDLYFLLSSTGYWIWKTQEIYDLLTWMKNYNLSHPQSQKLHFYGIDAKNIRSVLRRIGKSIKKFEPASPLISKQINYLLSLDRKDVNYPRELKKLSDRLEQDSSNFYNIMMPFYRQILQQHVKLLGLNMFEVIEVRDKFMSQNVSWLINNLQKNGKGILAAHNYHISKTSFRFPQNLYKKKTCGAYLEEALGDRYFAICTDFASGTTEAMKKDGLFGKVLIEENSDNLSHQWHNKKTAGFFVNLRVIDPLEKPLLNENFLFNDLGSTFLGAGHTTVKYNLSKQFDGYLYLQKITASHKPKENF